MTMSGRKNEQGIYVTTQNAMCKLLKGFQYFADSKKNEPFIKPDHIALRINESILTLENTVKSFGNSSINHTHLNE